MTRGTPGALLSVEGLSVTYPSGRGPVRAVNEVSFELFENECVALIGESGSGKSTLGQSLVRLLPRAARVSGDVRFRQNDSETRVLELPEAALRGFRWRSVAYVTQSAISAFNPLLRISAHFAETARAHGGPLGAVLQRNAFALLNSVRLEPARVWDAYPHELSGGMRQRVLIALALLLEPSILVLDEPTTALDVLTQRAILDVLLRLRAERRVSMVFISHDLAVASEIADRLFTMYAGRVVESGPVREVLRAPGHPYTRNLLLAIPPLEADRRVASIPGAPPDLIRLPMGCPFHPRCAHAQHRCTQQPAPPLLEVAARHRAACHFAGDLRREPLERQERHA